MNARLSDQEFFRWLDELSDEDELPVELLAEDVADLAFAKRLLNLRVAPGEQLQLTLKKLPSMARDMDKTSLWQAGRIHCQRFFTRLAFTPRKRVLGLVLLLLALIIFLASSPSARAQLGELIDNPDRFWVLYRVVSLQSDLENPRFIISRLEPVHQYQIMRPEEAQATFPTLRIPQWAPEGLVLNENTTVMLPLAEDDPFTWKIELSWRDEANQKVIILVVEDVKSKTVWRAWNAERYSLHLYFKYPGAKIEEVMIGETPTALLRMPLRLFPIIRGWDPGMEVISLQWMDDQGYVNRLFAWADLVSIEELVHMAASMARDQGE
jgi:hypothetical protein